jgi:AraC family transcriptional activator of pobA
MMASLNQIPVNKQKVTAVGGLDIVHLAVNGEHLGTKKDHRDEYYVLAVIVKGSGLLTCDMGAISVLPKSILLVKPYQVHSGDLDDGDSDGYFISIEPFLLPAFCKDIFDTLTVSQQCKKLSSAEMKTLLKFVKLLHDAFNGENAYKTQITVNLLNALVIYVSSFFSSSAQRQDQKRNQSYLITQSLKALVLEYSFLQPPSFFADKLNIATSHLNDCVKATIGISVTQYLQQTMLLEAKRQLYYTNADVKNIAFTLGFEDHTYFSRLFKKLTNEAPLAFRTRFRE